MEPQAAPPALLVLSIRSIQRSNSMPLSREHTHGPRHPWRSFAAGMALVPFLLLAACGPDAGEEEGDAHDTTGADHPAAGVLPDDPGELTPAPRTGVDDTVGAPAGAVPGAPGPAPRRASVGPDTLTGVVATMGAQPLVQFVLQLEDGRTIPLGNAEGTTRPEAIPDHPLAEIARLSGATVRVTGRAEAFAAAPDRGFAVEGYELLDIDGSRPVTGRLVRGDPGAGTPDRLESEGARPRVLVGMPAGTPASGSRVWVVGEVRGDSLLVESFGVLRPAGAG
ncbi:MAG: hypothetical protein EA350_06865 [Gemmatimonadales bacterium]|nr:MAG: hypothetical protein EA350_06865 [Gemmatimonadales bacterium]